MTKFTPLTFGVLYFLSNCPFYLLAWKRFGARFAFNSAISGALVSLFADHLAMLITLEKVNTIYCAVAGGVLMGLGMLILFRHRSSLGGFNVLCLFIQDKFGISVGKSQMAIDGFILLASFFFVSPLTIGLSILGAFLLNAVLAMNHKPSRYRVVY
ncbi:membrane protein [Vibrio mimicus MB451]|nr:membrane protein [Vibrio mimicus MB451]